LVPERRDLEGTASCTIGSNTVPCPIIKIKQSLMIGPEKGVRFLVFRIEGEEPFCSVFSIAQGKNILQAFLCLC
jgi:hypothetical protein